jgi:hypothetical protein
VRSIEAQQITPQEPAMSKSLAQVAAFAAAVVLTVCTVSGMNALASDTYRTASDAQLQSTPMAFAQHVTITGRRATRT